MIECPNCGKDVDNLEVHNNQFHESLEVYGTEEDVGSWKCSDCGQDFDNEESLGDHETYAHSVPENDQRDQAGEAESGYKCRTCGRKFYTDKASQDHNEKFPDHDQDIDTSIELTEVRATEAVCPSCNGSGVEDPETPNELGLSASQPCKTCGGSGETAGEAIEDPNKYPDDSEGHIDADGNTVWEEDRVGEVRRKATERGKKEIQKEIDHLQDFINVASFENPLNMGADNKKLSALQVEWANATEGEDDYAVRDQGEIIQSDTVDVEGEEMEHQQDKPEISQKDWDEDLAGLKDEYATEEDDEGQKEVEDFVDDSIKDIYDNEMPEKPATEDAPQDGEDQPEVDLQKEDDPSIQYNDNGKVISEEQSDEEYAEHENFQDYMDQEDERAAYNRGDEVDEIETSDDGTDVNTPVIPDVDNTDTDDTTINDRNQYPAEFSTETWDKRVTFNTKVQAFEGIGLNQGDALKLSELNWRELSIEVRGALNEFADNEKEEKRLDIQDAFNDEGAGDGADQPDTTIGDLDEIDYNIIGDNTVAVEKYECEHCNSGFKSNEALMIHYNDTHVPAREFMLDVPNTCTYCGQEIPANVSMGEHLAYEHGISLDVKLENGQVQDGYEQHRGKDFGGDELGRARTLKKLNDMEESEEGGQGSGPKKSYAPLPEQTARTQVSPDYDPHAPDPDPIGDPRDAKLTETKKIKGNENLKKKIIGLERSEYWSNNFYLPSELGFEDHFRCKVCGADVFRDDIGQHYDEHEAKGDIPSFEESWKPHIYKATEAVSYAEEDFKEDEHPREDSGKFTSGGGSGSATKQKSKPKLSKTFNKAKDKILKQMGEPKDDYDRKKQLMIKNLDGYPQHSSQLRSVGVRAKVPIMKAHLQDVYPESKWSVRTEYFSMGSAIRAAWTGGGPYPYGATAIKELYSDSGATDLQTDYFDTDNYVDLYDHREDKPEFDHGQHIYKDRTERFQDWTRIHLDQKGEYEASNTWSQKMAEDFTKGDVTGYQGVSDDVLNGLNELYNKFQDQEKKEGGGATPKEVPKSTTPASYMKPTSQQRANEPHEFPIDPDTGEDLPVSAYNPNAAKYRKPDPKDTKEDVTKAQGLVKSQKKDIEQPWQKGGESYAKEDYIPAPYDKHFRWEASMDQDDYICKHCGEMMMTRDGSNALHTAPESEVIEVVKQHLLTHSIVESYAKEVEHEKCPHCNFETSWKEGDSWQEEDAKTEMNNHIVTHGTTEAYVVQLESGHDYSPDRKRVFDNEEEARKYEYELKMSNFDNPYDIPVLFSKEAYAKETTIDKCIHCGRTADNHANPNTTYRGLYGDAPATDHYYEALDDGVESYAREYQVMCEHCGSTFDLKPDLKCEYCGKVNDSYASAFEALMQTCDNCGSTDLKKVEGIGRTMADWDDTTHVWEGYHCNTCGYEQDQENVVPLENRIHHVEEAMYGYGSATGRMSPRDAWEQGASSEAGLNPVFQEFRTLHWSEVPVDIQELWKSELEYLTVGEARAKEFEPERQGKKVKLLTGDYAGKTGTISSVSIFGDDFHVRVDGVHNEYEMGVPINPSEVEFLGGEGLATEEEVPWDMSEGDRARLELQSQDFVTEDDPDFENDPDYQGFVDDVKVEPSQYTQSGMDKEEKNRGDIDNDALEAKATEGQYKSFVCDQTFDVGDSRDFHDSMHLSNSDTYGFGYKTINGKCVTTDEYDKLGGE